MEWLAIAVVLMLSGGGSRRRRDDDVDVDDTRPAGLDAFGVAFARGSSSPAWPVEDASSHPVTADFGDGRPYGSSSPSRHHCGEDLPAPEGSHLVAVEDGRVVWISRDWYKGNGAVMLQLDSGPAVNYGEVNTRSLDELGMRVGTRVRRGQRIARSGTTDHVHFETYRKGTKRSYDWSWTGKPPAQLLDPTEYLRLAASS